MGKGDKPRFKLKARAKEGKAQRITIASAWPGKHGYQASLDRTVKEIVMQDGTVINGSAYWFDLFDEQEGPQRKSEPDPEPNPPPSDDWGKIPF